MRGMRDFQKDADYVMECVDLLCEQFSGWRYRSVMGLERCWRPPTDVYETEDSLFIVCEIAGVRKADYQVDVEGNRLTISGVREERCLQSKTFYHCMEIDYCFFERNFPIPEDVNIKGMEVSYKNGLLEIKLPKKTRSRNIPIE